MGHNCQACDHDFPCEFRSIESKKYRFVAFVEGSLNQIQERRVYMALHAMWIATNNH